MKIKTKDMIICALFTALTAVGAFIQVPVPGMDYFTLQFLFVLMAGLLLGSKRGAISVAVYVLIGLCGVPVFAAGGGISYVLRPSFGFLLSFIVAAFLAGLIVEKINKDKLWVYFLACAVGFITTYGIGLVYKYFMLNLYVGEKTPVALVLLDCFPIDMPGDIFLCVLAAILASRLRPVIKKMNF